MDTLNINRDILFKGIAKMIFGDTVKFILRLSSVYYKKFHFKANIIHKE